MCDGVCCGQEYYASIERIAIVVTGAEDESNPPTPEPAR